jgi:cation diffusion facilitator CzcD-associated flavoprotein CzcO
MTATRRTSGKEKELSLLDRMLQCRLRPTCSRMSSTWLYLSELPSGLSHYSNNGTNTAYTDSQKETFRSSKSALVTHARDLENQVKATGGFSFRVLRHSKTLSRITVPVWRSTLRIKNLLKGFTPKFAVGWRRVTPGNPYMKAMQEPNVDVHFTGVREVTDHGVMGEDGVEREIDTIVCATGFVPPALPSYWSSRHLSPRVFGDAPECYLELPFHLSQTTSCTEVRVGQQ